MIEREWREASDLRTSRFALAAVLIAAVVLRIWGLRQGIPHAVQVDEPEIVERAFTMMRGGTLHPHFFDYPSLTIYIQMVVSCLRFLAGAISGALADPSRLVAMGRAGRAIVERDFSWAAAGAATLQLYDELAR